MKHHLLAILTASCIALTSCTTDQQANVGEFLASPTGQTVIKVTEVAASVAIQIALTKWGAGSDVAPYIADGLRQLQGTPQQLNPVAMTTAIQSSGMPYDDSQVLAGVLYNQAVAAMKQGATAPIAAEALAAGADITASK